MALNCLGNARRGLMAAVLITAAATGSASQAETLADALVSAYNHSGLLEQNRAVLRAADEDVAIAGAALKPVLSWSGSITQSFSQQNSGTSFGSSSNAGLSASIGLTAQMLLYDFGASQFRIDAAKETVLATRNTLLDIEQQVLLQAVNAYMTVIQANETVALRKNNMRLLTQELRAARDRFEVGEVTRTDVALAEAQLAEARSGLAFAEGELLRARELFGNVVGRAPGRLTPPPRLPALNENLAQTKALAVRRHPQILAAKHQVAAADLLVRAGDAALNPTVTLNGQLGVTESFNDPTFSRSGSVGLNLNQTIYQGGALSANIRRSMAQRDAQRANLHLVRHNLEQNAGNAFASLLSSRAQLEASERQIRAARIAFEGVREEAKVGARTTLDVLDSEQALLDAQVIQVSARAQLYVAAYSVIAASGRLTARDLKLPVQIYDPAAYYNLVKDGPAKLSEEGKKLDRVLRALQRD